MQAASAKTAPDQAPESAKQSSVLDLPDEILKSARQRPMILTHYIIAGRDLTVADLVAQVAHAAGESFSLFTPKYD